MADISGLNTTDAVAASAATEFTATIPFKIEADGLQGDEFIRIHRLGPSGNYYPLTNEEAQVVLGAFPNTVYIDTPGTYRLEKTVTESADVYVSWEEV